MMGWMAPLRHLGAKVLVGNRREFITLLGGAAGKHPRPRHGRAGGSLNSSGRRGQS